MSFRSRRWKVVLVSVGLLLVAAIWGVLHIRGLEASALRLAEAGRDTISLVSEMAGHIEKRDLEAVTTLYAEGFDGEGPASWEEEIVEQADGVTVTHWRPSRAGGLVGVRSRFARLIEPIAEFDMVKMKLDRIEAFESEHRLRVRTILWLRGIREDGAMTESKARFRVTLVREAGFWRIAEESLIRGETVRGPGRGFEDVAARAGLEFKAGHNPMYETPDWSLDKFAIFKYASGGVSSADYDGDGFYDLFFAAGDHLALYRNLGTGRFEDVTATVGLPGEQEGMNAGLFADFDNDGDKDLMLGGLTVPGRLFRNDDGRFAEVPFALDPLVTLAQAVDYDNDGDLDVYVGRYLDPRKDLPTTLFYTRNGAGNTLLRNEGGFRFTDVTDEAGVREGGLTLGMAWGDYDEDGDQDVYLANDFGRNALLRNNGDGTFSDVTEETGTLDFGFGMSASFADADNDGDLDLYVSNVASSQRWYGQAATLHKYLLNSVKQGTIGTDLPLYREILDLTGEDWKDYGDRMVKGSSLMLNDGTGRFTDVSERSGANPLGWYWGSNLFDFDNDTDLDIFAANGWITGKITDDL